MAQQNLVSGPLILTLSRYFSHQNLPRNSCQPPTNYTTENYHLGLNRIYNIGNSGCFLSITGVVIG